jgi:hypothetical protein
MYYFGVIGSGQIAYLASDRLVHTTEWLDEKKSYREIMLMKTCDMYDTISKSMSDLTKVFKGINMLFAWDYIESLYNNGNETVYLFCKNQVKNLCLHLFNKEMKYLPRLINRSNCGKEEVVMNPEESKRLKKPTLSKS